MIIIKIIIIINFIFFSIIMIINELYINIVEFFFIIYSNKSVFWEIIFVIYLIDRNDSLMNSKDGMIINFFFLILYNFYLL